MSELESISPETLTAELQQLIGNALERDASEVPVDARLVEDLGVDSVMRLQILVILQRAYNVQLEESDLVRLASATILDIRDLLIAKHARGQ